MTVAQEIFGPSSALRGTLTPPADKSISHRAALIAAMSEQPVEIKNFLEAADTLATLRAIERVGCEVESRAGANGIDLTVAGVGLRGARNEGGTIDVGNAGTLMRLLPGWLAGQAGKRFKLDGDESVRRRPVDRIVVPLTLMGARLSAHRDRLPPLTIEGAELSGIEYLMPVASAQVKSCLLLAGLLASGSTIVIEETPTRDHTERMLFEAGVPVRIGESRISVSAVEEIQAGPIEVPGDISSAAFWIVAATLIQGSEIQIENVGINPTRTGLLDVLERMGGSVEVEPLSGSGSPDSVEPRGRLTVRAASLRGTVVTPEEVPLLIDELPLVALLGCFADGETVVRGAAELRHKESDRIATVVNGLAGLGARIEATADGFAVDSTGDLAGGTIDAAGDHRIAMLGAIAGLASREGVTVAGVEAATVSYPKFIEDLQRISNKSFQIG